MGFSYLLCCRKLKKSYIYEITERENSKFAYYLSFYYHFCLRKLKVKGKMSDILITIASQEVLLNNGKAINIFRWTIYTFHTMLFVSKSYFIYKSLKLGIYKYTICVYNSFTRINLKPKDEVEYAKIQVVP